MSIPPLPAPLQELGSRRFSFYPAILNVAHNEWIYRRATWSEIVVVNSRSGEEICIPHIFVGDVSIVDHPVVIVGLRRELEWKGGAVYPHRRAVIELPVAVNDGGRARPHPERPAPVVSIRLEPLPEKRAGKKVAIAMMLGSVGCLLVADFARQAQNHFHKPLAQVTAADTYASITGKFGSPVSDRSINTPDRCTYRLLEYPARQFTVVLMSLNNAESRYIGAIDLQGRVLNAVPLGDGISSARLLRSLVIQHQPAQHQ